jgi:D-alanyl-D-alanine carboxypeptidase
MKSSFRPGTGFVLSNMGYRVAGIVIERLTDRGLVDLLNEKVLAPAELTRTAYKPTDKPDGIATGYLKDNLLSMPVDEWSGASLVSNPQDLVLWAKRLYEEDLFEGPYLEDLLASGYRGSNRDSEYGLGVYIYETTAGEAYGHIGTYPGFATNLIYFPRHEIAVCIQVNRSEDTDTHVYVQELAQVILSSLPVEG